MNFCNISKQTAIDSYAKIIENELYIVYVNSELFTKYNFYRFRNCIKYFQDYYRKIVVNLKLNNIQYLQLLTDKNENKQLISKLKGIEDNSQKKEKKKFIQKCGFEGCRGFLSQAWKCGVCNHTTCSKCFEIKNEEHICDENTLKTAQLIKKETKNCPSCATTIYKISGCDQMWCTNCNVAFSWKTGQKVNGVIHNPHYFEWKKKQGERIRQPGEVVCGGLPNQGDIWSLLRYFITQESERNKVVNLFRGTRHIQNVILRDLRRKCNGSENDQNEELRIKYLINKINEKQFKSTLMRRDKAIHKATSVLHVYELISTVFIECINDIYQTMLIQRNKRNNKNIKFAIVISKIEENILKCNQIKQYVKTQLIKISKEFEQMVPVLQEDYMTKNIKF